jgi:formate hydrogenlyase subunit 3/multisubunit Na+/H+ antiporter MnhD subunit
MRALCGAIITAGALIGMGLTALGIGTRYENFAKWETDPNNYRVKLHEMDTGLMYALVFLSIAAVIGLAISFLGLAYHHHRRHHEHLRSLQQHGAGAAPVAGTSGPADYRPS